MFFAICLNDTVIGYMAFNIRENGHEIGYCFHSAYRGKSYAKESHLATLVLVGSRHAVTARPSPKNKS